MIKETITYKDFNGQDRTEDFYFHLGKNELMKLEVSEVQGWSEMMKRIIEEQDMKKILHQFEMIIRLVYGIRSDDGKRFIKSEDLADEFISSAAYDELFMRFATDPAWGARFMTGLVPKGLEEDLKAAENRIQPQDHLQKARRATETVSDPSQVLTTEDGGPVVLGGSQSSLRDLYPDASDEQLEEISRILHKNMPGPRPAP